MAEFRLPKNSRPEKGGKTHKDVIPQRKDETGCVENYCCEEEIACRISPAPTPWLRSA